MRLIDADELIKAIEQSRNNNPHKDRCVMRNHGTEHAHFAKMVSEEPTAFDKEKVIEELVELREKEYNDSDEDPELSDAEEIYDEGRSQGRFEAYHRAIGIVDKGGVERSEHKRLVEIGKAIAAGLCDGERIKPDWRQGILRKFDRRD